MKLKQGVIINEVDGDFILVASGEAGKAFKGMIKLNKTAAFIAERLMEETDENLLTDAVCKEYTVGEEEAREGVVKTVSALSEVGLVDK